MSSSKINHPYYPRDLKIPNYVPNENTVLELLSIFFGFIALAILLTWIYSGTKLHLKGHLMTRAKICWFVSCAIIHGILEAYFGLKHKTLVQEQSLLSQMWKEYGNGDSRYVSQDSFTVCMETITGFVDGPLAVFAAYTFLVNSSKRHIFQLLLSLCQLYGDVLYFTTEIKEGFVHSQMYHPLYFWFYFVFLNSIWIVIPFLCIYESALALCAAQQFVDNFEKKEIKAKKKN